MRPADFAFVLSAGVALAGCASPAEIAARHCAGAAPPGSAAYTACLRTERQRQLRRDQERLDEMRYEELRHP